MKDLLKIILIPLLLCGCLHAIAQQDSKKYMVVAQDGSGDYTTIQEAVNAVRDFTYFRVTIFIRKGTYHEKLCIPTWKSSITLLGEDRDSTIITNSDYSGKEYPGKDASGRTKFGTFTSYTVLIAGNDIIAENLTFENAAGPVGQAVALHVEGDRCIFNNCRLLGNQDTFYGGRGGCRQYFKDCYIEGTTDFIFGPSTVVFDNCTIHSIRDSYITAASTPADQPFGLVFMNCKLTAGADVHKVYLGRPWRPYASTILMHCTLGAHILPAGWHNWDRPSNEQTARYAEYENNGEGAGTSERVPWSKQLTAKDAGAVTLSNIFGGWDPSAALFHSSVLKKYTDRFNGNDQETVRNYISNAQAYRWLEDNIPLLECPDSTIEQTYYYRWWTFRKHLKLTPDGYIFTEFITPVKHAGRYNALSCATGHHIYEGRWLRDKDYVDQYIRYWYVADAQQKAPRFHQFSSWAADAVYNRFLVNGDTNFVKTLLPYMDSDYRLWEAEKRLPDGLFWQFDVKDGMEESITGSRKAKNARPSISSYMYGNAVALENVAVIAKNDTLKRRYQQEAKQLKALVQQQLWDDTAGFFKVKLTTGAFSDAREAIGFIPWYFNLPEDKPVYTRAWQQVIDTAGFDAPWGLTTAERRHPAFRTHGTGHGCEWDGAIWPFASTQTLKGWANLLSRYKHHGVVTPASYYRALQVYARSHQKNGQPYIGEYQDEKTGYWLKGDDPRSSYYNHSGFCDLVISDLVGLKPAQGNRLELYPLLQDQWDWFLLKNVPYHGQLLTIQWDKTGKKYNNGKGLKIYSGNREIYSGKELKHVTAELKS